MKILSDTSWEEEYNKGEVIYATGNKKSMANNATLSRSGRRHRIGGMTSSSSATSSNSNCNETILQQNGDIPYHEQQSRRLSSDVTEDSPPEPAPPEIPPRGGSLHAATLRIRADYQLPPSSSDVSTCQEPQYLQEGK
ncbi:hypothetical protein GWI33_000904 [Rhynchophorus ferrugineus]|uniref:Uncharacterized protein n=1 Tax=Rhynchophorus ferrugineus TaxID=354439 RepID=A0A834LYJ2_RHYFE|nr:hypothetical protein GWI33_000904 [Rhynchophorus ferrugineus]